MNNWHIGDGNWNNNQFPANWDNNGFNTGGPYAPNKNHHEPARPQIRQILLNERNTQLRYIYFNIVMLDGQTPALDEVNGQPEINISSTGWSSNDIGTLIPIGFGRYTAFLGAGAIDQLGVILSRYIGTLTLECFGESVEIIDNYRQSNIFNEGESPTLLAYVTLSEAEAYFSTRLKVRAWEKSDVKDKLKSLVMATKDIDKLAFSGVKTSEYRFRLREFYVPSDFNDPYYGLSWVHWEPRDWEWDDRRANNNCKKGNFRNDQEKDLMLNPWRQDLEFPRNGDKIVPNDIKEATCEIALQYLNGFDFELETKSLNITYQSFTNTREGFDRRFYIEHIRSGINSARAWILIKPFLRDPLNLRIARVS